MRKDPVEDMTVVTPEVKLITASSIVIGELKKTFEKTYEVTFSQKFEILSTVEILDAYFISINEEFLSFYSTDKANVFSIFTTYLAPK